MYLDAATVNPALTDLAVAAQEAAGVWMLPGLVHPEAITWGTNALAVTGVMPAPFACVFASGSVSGVVAGAHGTTNGADSQSFSINLAPLVPASGLPVTAYVYATSGLITQTPLAVVGPPQGNPAYNSQFVPFVTNVESVATVVVSASVTPPDGVHQFTLATTSLASGQSSISPSALAFGGQTLAARIPTNQFQQVSTTQTLVVQQANSCISVTASGITVTLPTASTSAGRVFSIFAAQPSGNFTLAANGSDSLSGILPGVTTTSVALTPGSWITLASDGNGWQGTQSGLTPLTWPATSPPQPLSLSSSGGLVVPYGETVNGNLTVTGSSSLQAVTATTGGFSGAITAGANSIIAGLEVNEDIPGGKGEQLAVEGPSSGAAAIIRMTCPGYVNVYQRVDTDGTWNLVNSGYTAQVFSVDQSGNVGANDINANGVVRVGDAAAGGNCSFSFSSPYTTLSFWPNYYIQSDTSSGFLTIVCGSAQVTLSGGNTSIANNLSVGNEVYGNYMREGLGARGSGDNYRVIALGDFYPWSFGTSGYTYLPNGLIFQWGQVSTSGSGAVSANFPVAFPNAFLGAQVAFVYGGSAIPIWPQWHPVSNSSMAVVALNSGGGYAAVDVAWFVYGY